MFINALFCNIFRTCQCGNKYEAYETDFEGSRIHTWTRSDTQRFKGMQHFHCVIISLK